MTAAVDVRGLTMTYGRVVALDQLDLSLAPGQVVGLLGENGCGKTTLLKVLAGVLSDHAGEVRVGAQPLGPASKAVTSFLPDVSFLPDRADVAGCLRLYRDFFADFDEDKARGMLDLFGLTTTLRLREASRGMREKVQMALVMSRRARVFLLDEPISGVDPAARDILLEAIVRDLDPDSLLLVSSHLVHDLDPVLDAVVMLRHGRLLLAGQVDDLRAEHHMSIDQLFREVHR